MGMQAEQTIRIIEAVAEVAKEPEVIKEPNYW